MRHPIPGSPRAVLLALAAGLLPSPVLLAQSSTSSGSDHDGPPVELRRVEVTGSRIKRNEGDSPILVLSSKDLEVQGITSVGDILQRLPVTGSALNTKFNSAGNFGFPADGGGVGSGSTTLSLRSLGAKRVLVLVDGLRWVNESSASGVSAAVDLNTIPVSIIDRVEVLTDGASALYGSDAVAGVVNIITKKSQKGGLAKTYFGDYTTGDGKNLSANLSYGGQLPAARGDYFVDFSHVDQSRISSAETEQSRFPVPGTGVAFGSSAVPNGRFVFSDPNGEDYDGLCPGGDCNVTPNGPANPQVFPDNFHGFTSADRFNFAPFNLLLTPSERSAVFAQGRVWLNDRVRLQAKVLYQARSSVNQAAPEPIFIGPGAGTGGLADTIGIDVSNPFNPLGYSLDPNSNLVFAARRPVEGGPRVFSQEVDTLYLSTGLSGELDWRARAYAWDINVATSDNRASQTVTGTYNIANIGRALGPLADCTAPCVPLNFFGGPGTISAEQLGYIQFVEDDESEQSITLFTANLSGPLLQLPAGMSEFAAGYEHRRLSGSYTPDAVVIAGESNGVPSLPTRGRYSVDELYLELGVPFMNQLPLIEQLDLSLAARYSSYSTFGSTVKGKAGLRWVPINEQFSLRANYAGGFRAPSVGESFGAPARFDATLDDPCSDAADPQLQARCAALGVPDPASFQQANTQIGVRTGGSIDLRPETARSTTVGLVYSPAWLQQLAASERVDLDLSWYQHKVDNAIQAPDAQTQLDRCVASGDPGSPFCTGISRGSSGDINGFNNTLRNLGRIDTSGLDLALNWRLPVQAYGRLGASWQTTYVQKFESVATDTGLLEPRRVGIEVADSGIPRWRSTLRLNWAWQAYTASYALRYISALKEACGDAAAFASCSDPANDSNALEAVAYHDLNASWRLPLALDARLAAGVNNLLGQDPPVCVSCSLNGYDASVYDLPGQLLYIEAQLRF